jgi:hypothetical protein
MGARAKGDLRCIRGIPCRWDGCRLRRYPGNREFDDAHGGYHVRRPGLHDLRFRRASADRVEDQASAIADPVTVGVPVTDGVAVRLGPRSGGGAVIDRANRISAPGGPDHARDGPDHIDGGPDRTHANSVVTARRRCRVHGELPG